MQGNTSTSSCKKWLEICQELQEVLRIWYYCGQILGNGIHNFACDLLLAVFLFEYKNNLASGIK